MTTAFQPADPGDAARRRCNKWLRRVVAAQTAIVLAVVGGWLIWLAVATVQRSAARDRLRAAGVPASVAELAASVTPVADDVNPAVEYERAGSLLVTSSQAWQDWQNFEPPESMRTAEEQAAFGELQRAVVAENAAALAAIAAADPKIRPAVTNTRGDFGFWSQRNGPLPADAIDLLQLAPKPARSLAKLLAADSALAGDGGRVLRNTVRIVGIADALDDDAHSVVEHLVAVGVRSIAADVIREHAAVAARGPAALRKVVASLLLDDGPSVAGYRQAMSGEAAMQQGMLNEFIPGWRGMLLQPLLRGDQAQMADSMRPTIAALDGAERLSAARAALPDVAWLDDASVLDLFVKLMLPSLDRMVEADFRQRASLRLAAAALAAHRFAADHGGALPPTLDALVPAYLPAVPIDPMTADAMLRYDPARGRIWAVGADGDDDGGVSEADLLREDPTQSNRQLRGRFDEVVTLRPPAGGP